MQNLLSDLGWPFQRGVHASCPPAPQCTPGMNMLVMSVIDKDVASNTKLTPSTTHQVVVVDLLAPVPLQTRQGKED